MGFDFSFDEDQELLQSTVRAFLEKECTPEVLRACWGEGAARSGAPAAEKTAPTTNGNSARQGEPVSPVHGKNAAEPGAPLHGGTSDAAFSASRELWKKLGEIGIPGMRVPEAQGGMGLDEIDTVLLLEELGHAGLVDTVVSTACVAAPLLRELGDPTMLKQLELIATGGLRVCVGHPHAPFVEDAVFADLFLLTDEAGNLHAFDRDEVEITAQPCNDPARRMASVRFECGPDSYLADAAAARPLLERAFERGALACAAMALGVCARMLELSVAYTSERRQFGKAVGAFQAVKHHLADVKVKLEYARPLVQRAAWSLARGGGLCAPHVSMAKWTACEAAVFGARRALQCHGAIGYTWEQDLHIFMRRAWTLERAFGLPAFHKSRVREALFSGNMPLGPGSTFEEGD